MQPDAGRFKRVRFSKDGSRLAVTTRQGVTLIWNLRSGGSQPEQSIRATPSVPFSLTDQVWYRTFRFSTDFSYLAVTFNSSHLLVFRTSDCAWIRTLITPDHGIVEDFAFNHRGDQLAAVGKSGLQVWELKTGRVLNDQPETPLVHLHQVRFSEDDHYLITVAENHVCQVRDASNWKKFGKPFQLESKPIMTRFHPRNHTFMTVTETGVFQIWDWSRGDALSPARRHIQSVFEADLSPDGRHVAVLSENAVRVWSLPQSDARPAQKLSDWTRDLTLHAIDHGNGNLVPLQTSQIEPIRLEQRSSELLPWSTKSRTEWHISQFHEAFICRDITAATFHFRRLESIAPQHRSIPELNKQLYHLRQGT